MNNSAGRLNAVIERRAPMFEPLVVIAIISLISSWTIQPYITQALAPQGPLAQQAAQGALWLSGVLSPFAALGKALAAALVCWACAVFLGERLSFAKLLSVFCLAEVVFALRDLAIAAVLAARGIGAVHTTADLLVAFGVNAFVHGMSPLQRVGLETWDLFSVAWALAALLMIRGAFKTSWRSAAALAAIAFTFRALFTAATLLYSL